MKSTAKDVASYVQQAPEDRREAISKLRKLCLDTLKGYEECMEYGMPSYKRNGIVEVAFASQKNYVSFYLLKQDVLLAHKDLLQGLSLGKGCIRYARPDKIDFRVVRQLLVGIRKSKSQIC